MMPTHRKHSQKVIWGRRLKDRVPGVLSFIAFLLIWLPELLHGDAQLSYLRTVALKKMNTGWGSTLLKGIGCNWMVCLALWCNLTAGDTLSKIVACWLPISAFVWIGWEHSIANMFTLTIACYEGVPGKNWGHALAWNLIPATLGNIIGGLLFTAGQYLAYGDYARPNLAALATKWHLVKKAKRAGEVEDMQLAKV